MATKQANINIRVDQELKDEAAEIFSKMGMDMTTAITIFLKQTVTDYRLPFIPSVYREPNDETLAAMKEAERGEVYGPYDSVEALFEALENED
ncbi:type II toxin-antitoxin system RelB/DinJ family antitoxin [Atopobacter sp. AH10]|uniref:type II toxin-antitoxin system RelB/DinJ family antitoxin n=1 Tax=Atopobacter sp. AH10 TaxID=2315861 RepID=UPI000EF192A4|nr:type II toxin-antitoxin system RelB/DinJ family antitoxin [Atopobacter sp. AH10]RLK63143.1 type II toxin-antitoxin system RelB/DinJ family antitoxin [Atopobacter sp. AH10]